MGAADGFKQAYFRVMTMLVIDKIVDGVALCECLTTGDVFHIVPPKRAREGHVVRREGDSFVIDQEETKRRRAELASRLNILFAKGVKNDK